MSDQIGPATPFFIVSDISESLEHYIGRLGFEYRFRSPDQDPFFVIVGRGAAQIMLKAVGGAVAPLPNHHRHEWARWDAFILASDPDALAGEFTESDVSFHQPLADTDDNLRGFEVADPDGYICFFGRPR